MLLLRVDTSTFDVTSAAVNALGTVLTNVSLLAPDVLIAERLVSSVTCTDESEQCVVANSTVIQESRNVVKAVRFVGDVKLC